MAKRKALQSQLPTTAVGMVIEETTKAFVAAHLTGLGLEQGMNVVVHSRLISFGRIAGGAATVFDALKRRVGDAGTLVFPTYTLNLGPDDVYDRASTPSHGMGVLSEYARQQHGVQRTLCPMHGHAAIGAQAEALFRADHCQSLGLDSAFQTMRELDFRLLLLGCSFQEGATFVHHVEAVKGVPYREWLHLPRRIRCEDGTVEAVSCHYYGRKTDVPWVTDLQPVEDEVVRCRVGSQLEVGGRVSYLLRLDALEECVLRMLSRDDYALVNAGIKHTSRG